MNRREFFSNGAALAAAASGIGKIQAGPSDADASVPADSSGAPKFIIDSHIHCGGTEAWVLEMVRNYRPRNAMACVLTWIKDMDLMKNAAASHPDVFILYGRVELDNVAAVREIETFKKNGFVGMKFHSPQKDYDDPSYFQVYRLCEEYRLHMLFHTGISNHTVLDQPQWGSSSRMRPRRPSARARASATT
jgi:hypothetical protein